MSYMFYPSMCCYLKVKKRKKKNLLKAINVHLWKALKCGTVRL